MSSYAWHEIIKWLFLYNINGTLYQSMFPILMGQITITTEYNIGHFLFEVKLKDLLGLYQALTTKIP